MAKDGIYTFVTLGTVKVYVFDLMIMGGRVIYLRTYWFRVNLSKPV